MNLQERILGFILGISVGTAIGFFLRATETRRLR
jgi:ABC-type nitrate/sulfonate/bicarbonate transport system permease component